MYRVNLIPEGIKIKRSAKKKQIFGIVLAFLALSGLMVHYITTYEKLQREKNILSVTQNQLKDLSYLVEEKKQYEELNINILDIERIYDEVLSTSIEVYPIIIEILNILPQDIRLVTFNLNNNNLSIGGVSTGNIAIASLYTNLQGLNFTKDISIKGIYSHRSEEGLRYSFEINCNLMLGAD
jgi:Tfp pilus assembly protein PilN